jgi:RNA polymerase sigma-70 factor (ECF subfamily)
MDLATEFQRHRGQLFGVAYRMLGSAAGAEDVVQDAYLRLHQADDVGDVRAWLTTTVVHLAIDELRSARARRVSYVGPWLPEPLVSVDDDPADAAVMDESLSLALLVVLETLSPAERAVYVLREAFGLTFEEVARLVGRTPAACRQLAARSRRHVRERAPRFEPDAAQQRRVVLAFGHACARGDVAGLAAVLGDDVVCRTDGGGRRLAARRPIRGADRVLRFLLGVIGKTGGVGGLPAVVNGGPGLVVTVDGERYGVLGFTVAGGLITELDLVLNPDKLRHLDGFSGGDGAEAL